jgi:glycosyltransferase involved in cell wall biosynthesis
VNTLSTRDAGRPGGEAVAGSARPLRVCHVAYTFYENDNRVIRYAEALAERGDQVDVIALRRRGQSAIGETRRVRIHRIQRRAVTEKNQLIYLAKILWFFVRAMCFVSVRQVSRRYDIVHVHNVPDFLIFTAWLPKLMGSRLILDIHDVLPELYAGKFGSGERSVTFRLLLLVERLSCRFADHVIISNDLWREKLLRRTVSAAKCSTFLNYPDLRLFKPLAAEQRRHDGTFVVLYPGTLNEHQGLDVAIRAFALIKNRMPRAEFHIYGEGPARPQLVRLIDDLDLSGRVKILDRLPLDEIAGVMASADLGVVPKKADGFGNEAFSTKILEFMACGVPVVVSRTRIDTHYFNDTLVRFFPSGDERKLADVLLDAYERAAEASDWIRTAREFAIRHSWQERVGDYRFLVDSLVWGGPASLNQTVVQHIAEARSNAAHTAGHVVAGAKQ